MTCGPLPSAATSWLTSAFAAGSVIFSPSGARMTTRAVAPSALAAGKRSSSRSKAFWESVPGMENESAGGAGAAEDAYPMPPRSSTHRSAT